MIDIMEMPVHTDIHVEAAMKIAKAIHKDQPYGIMGYYHGHIIPVYFLVKNYTDDRNVLIAALFHDAAEDTELDIPAIDALFGHKVSDLVWRVTDESGKNRKERKAATYPKIAGNKYATLIKLADRYINTQGIQKKKMYQEEYPEFKQKLYVPGMWDQLWKELDEITKE